MDYLTLYSFPKDMYSYHIGTSTSLSLFHFHLMLRA